MAGDQGMEQFLLRLGHTVSRVADPEAGYRDVLAMAAEFFAAESGSLALRQPETGEIRVVGALDPSPAQLGAVLAPGEGILGWVVQQGEPLVLEGDASGDPRFTGLRQDRRKPGSAICWPLRNAEGVIGALSLNRSPEGEGFAQADLDSGERFLTFLEVGVENLRLQAHRARRTGQLQRLTEALNELQRVDRGWLERQQDLAGLCREVAAHAARIVGGRYAAIGVYDTEGGFRHFFTAGLEEAARAAVHGTPRPAGLLATSVIQQGPVRVNDVSADPRFEGFPEGHPPVKRLLAHPLRQGGHLYGAIYVADRADGRPFSEEDSGDMGMFAGQVADLLERLELLDSLSERAEELKQQFLSSVRIFSHLLEMRSESLGGHSRRVADLAGAIARRLGVGEADLQTLQTGALLHDVGELSLSDQILRRPYSLLHSRERRRMKEHPILGEATLMALKPLEAASPLIRHHHEYLDGSGYPDGLSGDQIPLLVRILTVANEYDDLVRGKLFVRPMNSDQALAYIRAGADRQYDPSVVAALADYLGRSPADEETREGPARAEGIPSGSPPTAPEAAEPGASSEEPGRGMSPAETAAASRPIQELESAQLQPGMRLAEDLLTEEGMLLLAGGHELNEELIRKIRYFERRLGRKFRIKIEASSGDPDFRDGGTG